ncbi:MAG: hypothetical protein EBZ78_09570 [Verrucomicrobia bacterium]|nr:hypothetical protein [Verrucomicrobiota bacterium]
MSSRSRSRLWFLALGISFGLILIFVLASGPDRIQTTSSVKPEGAVRPSGQEAAFNTAPLGDEAGSHASEPTSEVSMLPPSEQRKLSILSEILESKNDNDPRYDTELRDFLPEAKRAMTRRYFDTRLEKRNERGKSRTLPMSHSYNPCSWKDLV